MCGELAKFITEMKIDDDRIHTLTRYTKNKTGRKIIKSDHNILFGKFSIMFNRKSRNLRNEHFMFKCSESKKCFWMKLILQNYSPHHSKTNKIF